MRTTLAIAERELKSYFVSPIAYVIGAAFLLVAGFLFSAILLRSNEASLRNMLSNLSVIWLFVAPFITMRLLAEEARTGTMELLLTNPVRDFEVVLGKFIGALLFVLALLLLTLYYPAILFAFGSPDVGPIVSGYLGVILQAAAFISIGLMMSSFTQNQIVAAFVTFATLLLMWLSEAIADFVGRPFNEIFRYLSVTSHIQDFSRGVIDSSHVIYFLSIVVGALFITYLSLQTRRWRG